MDRFVEGRPGPGVRFLKNKTKQKHTHTHTQETNFYHTVLYLQRKF